VDGDRLGVVQVLDAHEGLDEERLGELEVDVHDGHHGDSHVRGAELVGNIKPQVTKKERMTYDVRVWRSLTGRSPEQWW